MISNIIVVLLNLFWLFAGIEMVFKKQHNLSDKDILFLRRLFAIHQIIPLLLIIWNWRLSGDALGYWDPEGDGLAQGDSWLAFYRPGTRFMVFLCFPLVRYLNMDFYAGELLFGMLGFSGIIYTYVIIRKFVKKGSLMVYGYAIFPLMLYSPNTNFWSFGIGKDSTCFFAILLFFYCLFDIKKKWFWAVFAIAFVYHIRPHMAMFLVASSFAALTVDSKIKPGVKFAMILVMLVGVGVLFNKVMAFLRLDEISTAGIDKIADQKNDLLNQRSGSRVDMSNYPLPFKVFTFLYRPLFIDTPNALGLIQSCENAVLLCLSYIVARAKVVRVFKAAPFPIKSMLIFALISALAFALVLGNLGIMLREKIPVVSCLLIFMFWSFYYHKHVRFLKKKRFLEAKAAAETADLNQ